MSLTLPGTSPLIYGMHEPMPAGVMPAGWILFLVEVGHGHDPHPGIDFGPWEAQGYGIICRIQHAWGDGGTLPQPQHLDGWLQRVRSLVDHSQFCHRWIIGNEPNLSVEWPEGWPLQPAYVAQCYNRAWAAIHDLAGHEVDEVMPAPVGPWNVEIGIDWIEYFQRLMASCEHVDAFALHTYSRGSDPASVTSEDKMSAPYQAYYNGFRTYRDWLRHIPGELRHLPAYITETNQNAPWQDAATGWIPEAYKEIDTWNHSGAQVIRALILYRWPRYDQYHIDGKGNVIRDFQRAQEFGYTWIPPEPPTPEPPVLPKPEQWTFRVRVEGTSSEGRVRTWDGELREL